MMSLLSPSSETLFAAQTVLFDAGRWLLTGAVTLFLGYAILMLGALLFSVIAGGGSGRRHVRSAGEAAATVTSLGMTPAHGGLGGVVATSAERPIRVGS